MRVEEPLQPSEAGRLITTLSSRETFRLLTGTTISGFSWEVNQCFEKKPNGYSPHLLRYNTKLAKDPFCYDLKQISKGRIRHECSLSSRAGKRKQPIRRHHENAAVSLRSVHPPSNVADPVVMNKATASHAPLPTRHLTSRAMPHATPPWSAG